MAATPEARLAAVEAQLAVYRARGWAAYGTPVASINALEAALRGAEASPGTDTPEPAADVSDILAELI